MRLAAPVPLLVAAAVHLAGVPAPHRQVGRVPFQKGMTYGIFSRSGVEFHRRNLEEIKGLGVDSVQIVVPRSMLSIYSMTLSSGDPMVTPSRESLDQAVAEAHRLGLRVFLFPIIYIQDLEGEEWRGSLMPLDWDLWWRNYRAFILEEARWAASRGVEILCVGSELCSTEIFRERWERLIADVRRVYRGLVTYSANWDHLEPVGFARALDFVGMNAYFEVGEGGSTPAGLASQWDEVMPRVEAWQRRHGKPVVVTEIGYQSRRGATLEPWNYLAEGEPDAAEQDLGYRAFIRAWSGRPWFAGAYFYLWWDEPGDGGGGYTPRGKPAAETLRRWYTQGTP